MKRGFYILMIMCAAIMVVSCDKTKSYTDMLKAEDDAIERLIKDSGFVVLKNFPKDSVFTSKQFVELENGVYLNIINKGNNEKAVPYSTDVMARFVVRLFMPTSSFPDTMTVDNLGPHSNGTHPVEFKYGYNTGLKDYYLNSFITPGMASALQYVGDSSRVKLIVPFKQSSQDFQSSGTPLFYQEVKFTFIK